MDRQPNRVSFRNTGPGLLRPPSHPDLVLADWAEMRNCEVEGAFTLDRYSVVAHSTLGSFSGVGVHSFVGHCSLGRYVSIGSRCSVGPDNHDLDNLSTSLALVASGERRTRLGYSDGSSPDTAPATLVEHDCWIGDNSVVLKGVTLGVGTVVGAGSVVTRDTEPFSVVAGSPARLIRRRFDDETCHRILESKWWEMPISTLLDAGDRPANDALSVLGL